MTLEKLPKHQISEIDSIQADRAVAQRLMAMGFLPGALVKVVQIAPFGDPITVELSGWRVSLRHAEAALVRTRPVATGVESLRTDPEQVIGTSHHAVAIAARPSVS